MPVLKVQSAGWLSRHDVRLGNNYLYCPADVPARRVKVTGYSKAGGLTQFLCHNIDIDRKITTGVNAKMEWVGVWFKELGALTIDWQKYKRVKLELQMSEQVGGVV